MTPILRIRNLNKTFVLHARRGAVLPVLSGVSLSAGAGECGALDGPSGAGKSALPKCVNGNCQPTDGEILISEGGETVDVVRAGLRCVIRLRRRTVGYLSRFLRTVPRMPAIEVVGEPLRQLGKDPRDSRNRTTELLARPRVPERLWSLPTATSSGGERQGVNIARTFILPRSLLLLDEPTASLDRETAIALIREAVDGGIAVAGVFHDAALRHEVVARTVRIAPLSRAAA